MAGKKKLLVVTTTTDRRTQILDALTAFVRQRSGLRSEDYLGSAFTPAHVREARAMLRRERREITRDLHDFRALLSAVQRRGAITAQDLADGFRAYSGRLSLSDVPGGGVRLSYTTGQYFPTEYRKAACAVLALVLFYNTLRGLKQAAGRESARAELRKELGARLAERWLD